MKLRWPSLPLPGRADWLFSAKSFAAAMLAVYIAQWAGLPRPFWAMLTAYVVSHPFAGAVRSKAVFRFVGTFIGSIATLLLVPALSNAPELLALALALWVALCLYVSLLDRTPRAYLFMLAGYTAALIGFPSVQTPALIFDTASARVEEIGLGILCATLVHSIVLPKSLRATVIGLLDRTLADARTWFSDLMRVGARVGGDAAVGEPQADPLAPLNVDRRRLAADITQLRTLSTHVPFDTSNLRFAAGSLHVVQDGVAALTPVFAAVEDRLRALHEAQGELVPQVRAVLDDVGAWIDTAGWRDAARTEALRQSIHALGAPDARRDTWLQALYVALSARLDQLIEGWQACTAVRADVDLGLAGNTAAMRRNAAAAADNVQHLDRGMALLSAFAAFVAISVACAFWILTGWPAGAGAAMMAAVFCSFFAGMDDPVPAIHGFMKFTLWSVPLAFLYVLVLMPLVQDMASLVLVCAPVFLVLGAYVARPASAGSAMAVLFGAAGALAAHDTQAADFVSYANSIIAQVVGIVIAARVTALVRSVGADWMARRIQRATWRELAEMARRPASAESTRGYAARTLDRIGLLAPRVAQADGTAPEGPAQMALRDLRMGSDIVALQRTRRALPPAAASSVAALLREVGTYFGQRAGGRTDVDASPALAHIDSAIAGMLPLPGDTRAERFAVAALVGLRRNLFAGAPPLPATGTPPAAPYNPTSTEAFA